MGDPIMHSYITFFFIGAPELILQYSDNLATTAQKTLVNNLSVESVKHLLAQHLWPANVQLFTNLGYESNSCIIIGQTATIKHTANLISYWECSQVYQPNYIISKA